VPRRAAAETVRSRTTILILGTAQFVMVLDSTVITRRFA
jgi:hypothetical protein